MPSPSSAIAHAGPEAGPGADDPLPRIAMVSTHGHVAASPPLGAIDTGGQVVYVLELSKKLAQLGHKVDIWTRRFEDQPETEAVNERVRIVRIPCGGNQFIGKEFLNEHIPEWIANARKYVEQHQLGYQFVNSHYWDAGIAGGGLATIVGAPHVHTPHSLGFWKKQQMENDHPEGRVNFETLYNFTKRISEERKLYAECSLIVATTPHQFDIVVKEYGVPPDKVRMVPPGYDDSRFFPVSEASRKVIRKRLGFGGKVVLAVGRLAANKGYDLLIEAFGLVAQREPTATLHLAVGGTDLSSGEAGLLRDLKDLAATKAYAQKIIFGSFILDEELADYYRAADLFILCSRYEPFGMTAIEAMASGTPTVITTHGGLYRALSFGRHALFADPLDKEDLGITMAKIFKHPRLRARLAHMGAHRARSLFTWTGVAQQIVAAVEEGSPLSATLDDTEWDEPWNDGD